VKTVDDDKDDDEDDEDEGKEDKRKREMCQVTSSSLLLRSMITCIHDRSISHAKSAGLRGKRLSLRR
jgi:hypothetical protein